MYWTTVGSRPSIFMADMSGENVQEMIDLENFRADYPTGIAVDHYKDGR